MTFCGAKEKGPSSDGPFRYWCWLQDLNPPPPDYKSNDKGIIFKDLLNFKFRNFVVSILGKRNTDAG